MLCADGSKKMDPSRQTELERWLKQIWERSVSTMKIFLPTNDKERNFSEKEKNWLDKNSVSKNIKDKFRDNDKKVSELWGKEMNCSDKKEKQSSDYKKKEDYQNKLKARIKN